MNLENWKSEVMDAESEIDAAQKQLHTARRRLITLRENAYYEKFDVGANPLHVDATSLGGLVNDLNARLESVRKANENLAADLDSVSEKYRAVQRLNSQLREQITAQVVKSERNEKIIDGLNNILIALGAKKSEVQQ